MLSVSWITEELINIVLMIAFTFLNSFLWSHSCCHSLIYPIMTLNSIYRPNYQQFSLPDSHAKIDELMGKDVGKKRFSPIVN